MINFYNEMSLEYNYTITSSDYNNYSIIRTNLKAPPTNKCEFMISTLTTTCNFTILNSEDYIHFILYHDNTCTGYYDSVIYFPLTVTGLNRYNFISIMNEMMKFIFNFYSVSDIGPIDIMGDRPFAIKDMSYRMKLVTGMYNNTFHNHEYYYVYNDFDKQNGIISTADYLIVIIKHNTHILRPSKNHIIDLNDLSTFQMMYEDLFHSIPEITVELEDKWIVRREQVRTLLKLNVPFRISNGSNNLLSITGLGYYHRDKEYAEETSLAIPGIVCSNHSGHYYIIDKHKFIDIQEIIRIHFDYDYYSKYSGEFRNCGERLSW